MSAPPDEPVFFTDRDLGTRFPEILVEAGLRVERHRDHFAPESPDDLWLRAVAEKGWIAVSHDARIRYKPNERDAVIRHRVRLLIVVGKAPFPELARHFVATANRIRAFIAAHKAPWIAKVYRPTEKELARNPQAPGTVTLWYPPRRR
ncbi:MAG: hypothetical protein N2653_07125 [Burkholderiales bacterium]|nr:hypothetical protein [Burkholderiales bacterium]